MNPIMQMSNLNPINKILQMINGQNPQNIVQNMLSNDPQLQNMLNSMKQQCGSGSPKDFVIEQCKNRGISEQDVLMLAEKLGIK